MPIYEFVCKECSKNFEDLVLNPSQIDEVICPVCGSGQVKKKMSTFASKPAERGQFVFVQFKCGFLLHSQCLRDLTRLAVRRFKQNPVFSPPCFGLRKQGSVLVR